MKHFTALAFLIFISTGAAAKDRDLYLVKFKAETRAHQAQQIVREAGFEIQTVIEDIPLYVVKKAPGKTKPELSRIAAAVEYVEKDEKIWRAIGTAQAPNDPLIGGQFALNQIDAYEAWDQSTGSPEIVVAVVDSGAAYKHPDLVNQIWQGEGWNYVGNNNDPMDDNGHGTHVAGIIGAEGNNGIGVAGVNWHVRILPVKALDKEGSGTTLQLVQAVLYAANHGARVINASWGGTTPSAAMRDAIAVAWGKGALFVCAAGNDGQNGDITPHYPAAYDVPGIIAVAATQAGSGLAYFSNYGPISIRVAAPGHGITSTIPGNGYANMSGTSMASPVVAGVAGLILSKNPALTPLELRNAVLNAVEPRSNLTTYVSTGGEINARLGLTQLSGSFQVWPKRMTVAKGTSFQFSAYPPGSATWAVSDTKLATVDSSGNVSAKTPGTITISAQGANGNASATLVISGQKPPAGGNGCKNKKPDSVPEAVSAMFSMGLPFIAAFWVRRRRSS